MVIGMHCLLYPLNLIRIQWFNSEEVKFRDGDILLEVGSYVQKSLRSGIVVEKDALCAYSNVLLQVSVLVLKLKLNSENCLNTHQFNPKT